MKYFEFLLGNTSSDINEVGSFGKYTVNIGSRQKRRARSENVIDCEFESIDILNTMQEVKELQVMKE